MDLKGLVFYPGRFEAAGYQIPHTWDELVALSRQIVADGGTPWCFGFESGFASGWPGSDLLESLVLRVGRRRHLRRVDRGDVGFTSPAVVEAGRLADALVFEPGFVRGGPEMISSENYAESAVPHAASATAVTGEAEPDCWLYHQANFALRDVPPGTRIGEDIDFFMLPPVDPGQPTPRHRRRPVRAALVDRPEVRAFMELIASPEWGEVWAADADGSFISGESAIRHLDIR